MLPWIYGGMSNYINYIEHKMEWKLISYIIPRIYINVHVIFQKWERGRFLWNYGGDLIDWIRSDTAETLPMRIKWLEPAEIG